MKRAAAAVLAMMLLVPATASAHDEMPWADFQSGMVNAVSVYGEADSPVEIRAAASRTAAGLQAFLVTVVPMDCYMDLYVIAWRVYGSLYHLADAERADDYATLFTTTNDDSSALVDELVATAC